MKRSIIAATMLLLAVAHPAVAAAPPVISYQGVLTEVNGQLVPDGPHIFTFSVWDAAQNGNMLYCESQALAIVKGGVSALVGSGTLCANPPNPSLQSLTFDVPLLAPGRRRRRSRARARPADVLALRIHREDRAQQHHLLVQGARRQLDRGRHCRQLDRGGRHP